MIFKRKLKIGLIVNPYAGIGGAAALKGSDGEEIRQKALAYHGADLQSPKRLQQCLDDLIAVKAPIEWVTAQGIMGAAYLQHWPWVKTIYKPKAVTSSEDTRMLASLLMQSNVDMILFVGGDGTARDIQDVVSTDLPCLGLPSGVKMQSGVFALSPIAAAEVIKGLMRTELMCCLEQDVRDIDESALREGRVRSTYYGSMRVPDEPRYIQNLKQGGKESEALVLDDISDQLEQIMADSDVLLIGPGSTTHHFMMRLGLENTLVGFDAISQGKLIGSDLDARGILRLYHANPEMKLVISPTGQQGILLGRGNQQLSPELLRQLRKEQIIVVATKTKLKALEGRPLIVDSNDQALDKALCGLYPVISGFDDFVFYPVNTSYP